MLMAVMMRMWFTGRARVVMPMMIMAMVMIWTGATGTTAGITIWVAFFENAEKKEKSDEQNAGGITLSKHYIYLFNP